MSWKRDLDADEGGETARGLERTFSNKDTKFENRPIYNEKET